MCSAKEKLCLEPIWPEKYIGLGQQREIGGWLCNHSTLEMVFKEKP